MTGINAEESGVRIDVWRGLLKGRPFPEQTWLRKMYVAHDLEGQPEAQVGLRGRATNDGGE